MQACKARMLLRPAVRVWDPGGESSLIAAARRSGHATNHVEVESVVRPKGRLVRLRGVDHRDADWSHAAELDRGERPGERGLRAISILEADSGLHHRPNYRRPHVPRL